MKGCRKGGKEKRRQKGRREERRQKGGREEGVQRVEIKEEAQEKGERGPGEWQGREEWRKGRKERRV